MTTGGNEQAFRRMMTRLKLRQTDIMKGGTGNPVWASLARNGLELAMLLDGPLDPRDRVACVRELRQLTERLVGTGESKPDGADLGEDDDDWDTPVAG